MANESEYNQAVVAKFRTRADYLIKHETDSSLTMTHRYMPVHMALTWKTYHPQSFSTMFQSSSSPIPASNQFATSMLNADSNAYQVFQQDIEKLNKAVKSLIAIDLRIKEQKELKGELKDEQRHLRKEIKEINHSLFKQRNHLFVAVLKQPDATLTQTEKRDLMLGYFKQSIDELTTKLKAAQPQDFFGLRQLRDIQLHVDLVKQFAGDASDDPLKSLQDQLQKTKFPAHSPLVALSNTMHRCLDTYLSNPLSQPLEYTEASSQAELQRRTIFTYLQYSLKEARELLDSLPVSDKSSEQQLKNLISQVNLIQKNVNADAIAPAIKEFQAQLHATKLPLNSPLRSLYNKMMIALDDFQPGKDSNHALSSNAKIYETLAGTVPVPNKPVVIQDVPQPQPIARPTMQSHLIDYRALKAEIEKSKQEVSSVTTPEKKEILAVKLDSFNTKINDLAERPRMRVLCHQLRVALNQVKDSLLAKFPEDIRNKFSR